MKRLALFFSTQGLSWYTQNTGGKVDHNLPLARNTSSWSIQISSNSPNNLSFLTKATTYFAKAAGSASQLKKEIIVL